MKSIMWDEYDLVRISPDSDQDDMADDCWINILCFYGSKQKYRRRQSNANVNGGGKSVSVSKSRTLLTPSV